jgi:hypothetical protein
MKQGLFNKRMPTLLALLVLIAVIGVSTFLIQRGIFYVGKAAPDTQPQNFAVTNVTDTSFTVLFTTSGLVDAVLNINDAKTGGSIILDDRDKKTGAQNKYFSHHITVPNLTPNTTYIFKLLVGGNQYTNPSYAIKTGQPIATSPPAQNPLFGKVLLPEGSIGTDSIVVATTDNSQKISAITDSRGEFILPTNSLRDPLSSKYTVVQNNSVFTINVFRQNMEATVKASFSVAQNLPPITLLQQYIFTTESEKLSTQSSKLSVPIPSQKSTPLSIVSPSSNEIFTDTKPLFNGTALPNSNVILSVKNGFSVQIVARVDGSWTYRYDLGFDPGKYTLSASSIDSSGNSLSVSKTFSVLPQGSQIVSNQLLPTTSPTLPPTQTPTPTSTPTPTKTPTPSPTVQVAPTPTGQASTTPSPTVSTPTPTVAATITPTATLQPTVFYTPTKLPPIAKPGGVQNSIILTFVSIILIVAGTALLFAL